MNEKNAVKYQIHKSIKRGERVSEKMAITFAQSPSKAHFSFASTPPYKASIFSTLWKFTFPKKVKVFGWQVNTLYHVQRHLFRFVPAIVHFLQVASFVVGLPICTLLWTRWFEFVWYYRGR